jgi:long-chain acyl-CoA synthetase
LQTYTTPGVRPSDPSTNTVTLLADRAATDPGGTALAHRVGDRFVPITASEMFATVKELAAGLLALGLHRSDRVAIFCSTRYEFTLLDYAIWAAGGATVTIYPTSSAEQVEWVLGDSESLILICETQEMKAMYDEMADRLPATRHALVIDEGGMDRLVDGATDLLRTEVERRIEEIAHDDLATLVYTSGTTGRPKGVMLNHGNLAYALGQLDVTVAALMHEGERTLLFLPLAHIASRQVQIASVTSGVEIYYASSVDALLEELAMVKPTWLFAAPRVFEKVYNGAVQKAHADGKGGIFDRAVNVAIAYSQGRARGRVGLATRAQHAVFDRLVYAKLRSIFGGELAYVISSAAPLGERLGHFYRGIGLTPIEAYGLTEVTGASNINTAEEQRIGTVGRPLPGTTIGIADDGEVLIKGGGVMSGYWRNEAATREAISEDGWFHSGDIGELDEDGYLRITGRLKEILITAGGKNVAPAVLEDRLRSSALVSQCVVVGDGQPFISALITIDEEALPGWAAANEKTESSLEALIDDPDFTEAVQQAVNDANQAVSRAESIREFRILPDDLTIEGGQLTPTLKVKRDLVLAENAEILKDIYKRG